MTRFRANVYDRCVCAAAGFIALSVYLATLAPGLTGEDSGELIAAAWTLGIPHPPGYPLWCLTAYPFMHLIHFGSVAWRANLASAAVGALGAWLLAEAVLTLTGRRLAAVAAGLALAFSSEYWQQSVIAEVYTIAAALVALHLLLLARWTRSRHDPWLFGAAVVGGLAAAHYTLNLLLIPMMLAYVFVLDLRPRRVSRYILLVALTLPGWLIYLYLPLRSLANPAMDWGNPESWRAFLDVVSRAQYRDLIGGPARSVAWLADHLQIFSPVIAWQFTPWAGACAVLGVVLLWRNDRAFAAYCAAGFIGLSAAALFAPNLPQEYHWTWTNTPYFIPAYVFAAVGIGGFVASLQNYHPLPRPVPALAAVVVIASPLLWNYRDNDRRGDHVVADYAKDLLNTMVPNAIYFGGGDHTIFPAVYLQLVDGARRDVLLANRYGYPLDEAYALAGEKPPTSRPSTAEEQRIFEALLVHSDRPVYSAIPREAPAATRLNEGLLYRYLRTGETARDTTPPLPPAPAFNTRGDWSNELVAHEYLAARGRAFFDAHKPAEALDALDRAARIIHDDKNALNNLGINAAEGGEIGAASVYFHRALESDPHFAPAAINLARCYLLQSTPADALKLLDSLEAAGVYDPAIVEMRSAALNALEGR